MGFFSLFQSISSSSSSSGKGSGSSRALYTVGSNYGATCVDIANIAVMEVNATRATRLFDGYGDGTNYRGPLMCDTPELPESNNDSGPRCEPPIE